MQELSTSSDKIEIASLADECYKRIKHDILVGKISWGARLNVISLAGSYGISRSPVVKAIDRLSMERLVRIIPNKGSFVSIPTEDDVVEVTEIRLMIENTLCTLAYSKNKDKLVESLKKLDASILPAMQNIQFEDFLEYDRHFHSTFSTYANNNRLRAYYESIRSQIELFRTKTFYKQNIEHAMKRHTGITECLTNGDLGRALDILKEHISDVQNETIESIRSEKEVLDYE
ncbi:GntR family transcriptional regulator [Marispirochaeta sp.]|uniref:GntR family transcriptional regulator n=1 Tax=Marispirochaeta sp. TaxID=2038653 RepID=UPI0029C83BC6|nr:GntR family transcriptional regulator [Marispirochaeta sp.]